MASGRSSWAPILAGEPCPQAIVARHHRVVSQVALFNEDGLTEGTVWSSVYACRNPVLSGPVAIGRPIANTQIYILDEHLQPVPIGVPGELHIGGAGVARGYLNRPELTAEKFIPDPFGNEPGTRLYKTGDLARYLADGNIECLGRLDEQVKIRGFRVEPGEVEAILTRHPAVVAAAVVVGEDAQSEKRLVAFAVPLRGLAPTPEELRTFLKRKLPEYMLPWRFEFLVGLPLTPSGKVDRKALRARSSSTPAREAGYMAPQTELEEKLATIWGEVLKVERVGAHDNFFDLGGHSLLAVRLIARVEKQFGKKLTLASIFQSPTIQDQADAISRPGSLNKVPGVIPIQPEGSGPPFFCFGAGPLFRPLALRLGTEHPFLGLGLDESEMLELPAPFKLEDIAAPLVAKLRKLQPEGPYSLGGWCEDGVVAFEAAQQLVAQGQSVALLALFDTWNPAAWQSLSRHRAFQVRLHHRAQKLKYHSSNLRGLEPKKVYEYLADRWNTQLKSLGNRIWRAPRFPQTRSSNPAPNRAIEG